MFRAELLRSGGDASEVHERASVLLVGFGRFGAGQADLVEFALEFIGAVRRPHALEDPDDLAAAGVADLVTLLRSRHVRGDDVDAEPTLRDVIEGGEGASEHGWPDLAHAQGDELVDRLRLRGHRRGEGEGILSHDPARGQEDVLIAEPVGHPDNVTTVFVAAAEFAVGHAEELVVVAAECGKPGHFDLASGAADGDGRSGFDHGGSAGQIQRSIAAIFAAASARTGSSFARKARRRRMSPSDGRVLSGLKSARLT